MRADTLKHRLLALVLGALFIGLVPIVHAFCVAPVAFSLSATNPTLAVSMVHMMADGSTMAMVAPGAGSAGAPTSSDISESPYAATLGSLLVAVGVAMLTFFGLRRCLHVQAVHQSRTSRPPPRRNRWPNNPVVRAYSVNLDCLGVCRT
jgi:hypothetical protein